MLEATTVETKAETTEAADLSETIETTVPATVAIGIVQSATTTTSLSDKNATDAVKQRAAVADAPTTVVAPMTVGSKAVRTAVGALSETIVPTTVAIGIVQSATTTTSLSDKNATDAVKQRAAVADAPTTVVAPTTVDSKAVKTAVDALSETIVPTIVKMAIGTVRNATMTTSLGEPSATSVEHQRLAEAREEMIAVSEDPPRIGATEETTTTEEAVVEARCTPIMIGSAPNATTQISHSDKNATDAVILVAVAEAADKAVHHDAMTDEVAIHVEEIHEVADKAVHHDATTDEVAIHEAATDSEVATDEVAIHEVATDEVAIHEVATDEVAIHAEEIHEVATDEVAIHAEEIHEAATDEVAIHAEEIHEAATDEVAIHAEEIHEAATDEVAIHAEEIHEVAIHALLAVNLENSVKPAVKKPMVMLTTDRHATLWVEMTDS